MAIIEKKPNQLATVDLSPISIPIPILKEAKTELDELKAQLIPLQDVNEKNIKLAMNLKELRGKYTEEKAQHRKTKTLMHEYFKAETSLNIVGMICPYLKREIKLVDCNHSCSNDYCGEFRGYDKCATRINHILQHFKIPVE